MRLAMGRLSVITGVTVVGAGSCGVIVAVGAMVLTLTSLGVAAEVGDIIPRAATARLVNAMDK
jgi:hypothetical protein